MKQHELVIVPVPVEEIQQHPENPNNGDVDAIEESIAVNGLYSPVWVQRSTGYIVKGNHTYLGAMRSGFRVIGVIYLDLTDEEALRIMLVDNQSARKSMDDEAQLFNLLDALRGTDLGLAGTGFDIGHLEYLHQLVTEPITAADLGVDEPADGSTIAERAEKKRRLDFTITPQVNDDGECEALVLARHDFRRITAADFQALRVALGFDPLNRVQLAGAGVPDWETN